MRPIVLAVFLLTGFLALPACGAGETMHIYVASRAYDVSVAPVDEQSKDAESSMLYQRRSGNQPWESLGVCRKETLPNGIVRFTREVDVESDGIYQYTSRPVVQGDVENPPDTDTPPQAIVVVDTLPPTAEILRPAEAAMVDPGQRVNITWVVSDENLPERPSALAYSTDAGKSWNLIESDLPAEGELDWFAPGDLPGPAVIRLAAVDRAGNVGRDLRRLEPASAPVAKTPEPDTVPIPTVAPDPEKIAEKPAEPAKAAPPAANDQNRSWLYYLMAVNLMRQNKPADALQYYWLSVKEDPEFIDAWADISLAYIDLGAYQSAREVAEQTRERAPERIDLMHLMGETYHAEGMAVLGTARTAEERVQAKALVDQAVVWYGRALDKAAADWRLAEQAASFYRLGEICYYVNMDRDGARAYWKKILALHTPAPNMDLLLWSRSEDRPKERLRHERYTYQRVSLDAWQNWARGYLEQMDARERAGILDLMPAQRASAVSVPVQSLSYAGNALNPGREDGRSLFSLPGQLGSPDDVAACAAVAGPTGEYYGNAVSLPSPASRPPVTEGYSFYGKDNRSDGAEVQVTPRRTPGRSNFSGGPDYVPALPVDPYVYPQNPRGQAAWNGALPYGNEPVRNW